MATKKKMSKSEYNRRIAAMHRNFELDALAAERLIKRSEGIYGQAIELLANTMHRHANELETAYDIALQKDEESVDDRTEDRIGVMRSVADTLLGLSRVVFNTLDDAGRYPSVPRVKNAKKTR